MMQWGVGTRRLGLLLLIFSLVTGCSGWEANRSAVGANGGSLPPLFTDVTAASGIRFKHYNGGKGEKYMPETVGSGVAFLDYNNDGKLDLLFVNGTDWPHPDARPHYPALYRNNGDGTFTDVTEAVGLKIDVYGMGVTVGDYDNDGWPDIYLTCIGPNHLFHNNGNGTFTDVTAKAGVAGVPVEPGGIRWKWSSSATFCDYDRDGIPDLFVCQYVKWTPMTDVVCLNRSGKKAYCAPGNYEGTTCTLYHGRGDGTFEDVTAKVGIAGHVGKALGVVVADLNGDGWPDIAVTNDTSPNFLFLNEGGKRFREVASECGFAVTEQGKTKAGMGIDIADYQNNGHFGLLTGNFSGECLSLYTNDGHGVLTESAYAFGVAEPSLNFLTFGLFFFDYDLDGRVDFCTANGHIDDFIHDADSMITYRERPLLFHNECGVGAGGNAAIRGSDVSGKFVEVGMQAGAALTQPRVGRGCTWGDWNLDGHPGIALLSNNEAGLLWRNDTTRSPEGQRNGKWIGLRLRGTRSCRDAWGAVVRVQGGGRTQTFQIYGGGSFLSQRQVWPLIGLNRADRADRVEIDWPSGAHTKIENIPAGRYYEVVEGDSIPHPF